MASAPRIRSVTGARRTGDRGLTLFGAAPTYDPAKTKASLGARGSPPETPGTVLVEHDVKDRATVSADHIIARDRTPVRDEEPAQDVGAARLVDAIGRGAATHRVPPTCRGRPVLAAQTCPAPGYTSTLVGRRREVSESGPQGRRSQRPRRRLDGAQTPSGPRHPR